MKKYYFYIAVKPDLCDSEEDVKRLSLSLRRYFSRLRSILPDPDLKYCLLSDYQNGRLSFYGLLFSEKIDQILYFIPTATLDKRYHSYGLDDRFGLNRFVVL